MVSPDYIEDGGDYRDDTDDIEVGISEEVAARTPSSASDIELEFGDDFDSRTAVIAYSTLGLMGVVGAIAVKRLRQHKAGE